MAVLRHPVEKRFKGYWNKMLIIVRGHKLYETYSGCIN